MKQGDDVKSRLANARTPLERDVLAERLAQHVVNTLAMTPGIKRVVILSPTRPDWWDGDWAEDGGHGLNAEIAAWRHGNGNGPMLVIHGDLPLVSMDDIAQLVTMADRHGAVLATDRAGGGTNALALRDGRAFVFQFGKNSRFRHSAQSPDMAVLHLNGLAADLDTEDDLAFLRSHGFCG
jgi:2-phospho-L-lactate guanylyltransferase